MDLVAILMMNLATVALCGALVLGFFFKKSSIKGAFRSFLLVLLIL